METDQREIRPVVRFGIFEADLRSGELRRSGVKVKLQDQPFQVLEMLLARPGELVTREELQKKLWSESTFVDFEHGLNAAIKRLREALDDSADNPRFVETLHRRGYRFIAPVEGSAAFQAATADAGRMPALRLPPTAVGAGLAPPEGAQPVSRRTPLRKRGVIALAGAAVVAAVAVLVALNVAGLRERLMAVVGAGSARPREGGALPYRKIESIAVLPLENLSGDPEQEYFSDGMTEELITTLGKIGSLRVISRTSVMRFKGARPAGGLAEIAQKLNVDAVVEGSVMRSGDRVRVTANLIDARSERHLWAESYNRDLHDVLALQGEVARAIAHEVKAKVTPEVQAHLAHARQVNPQAHELYLKGQYYFNVRGYLNIRGDLNIREDLQEATDYFQAAINTDPAYAPAHAGLASVYNWAGHNEVLPYSEAYPKARAAAEKALELDETLGEAHAALAHTLVDFDWDWTAAEREYKRAVELSPSVASIRSMYGFFLVRMGRHQEAIREARRGVELDPVSPVSYFHLGWVYWESRQNDQALEQYRNALELDPTLNLSFYFAIAYREKGMYPQAIAEFQKAGEGSGNLCHMANAYARVGRVREAREVIRKLKERAKIDGRGSTAVVVVYAGLGEKDNAFEWMEKAYQVRDRGMAYLKIDPTLDPLRSDPRFQALLRRMKFPP